MEITTSILMDSYDPNSHTMAECDDLRCDMRSCRTSHIYSLRYKGVRLIGNGSHYFFQSGSDTKCLQMTRHMLMMANWRVILRVRRHFTAHHSGATSDCCEYILF
jgi:hypothetical protein